ncbi:OLC1v1014412C1 [Oldenlandia corymbosa var. corymbosa]|uniref:OLC1v1014412C1 n=1 Tax=Oldenlandia corymbosa var. corymbosa TaxID=529605 RepID=A0AAV1E0Q3_OLDCO|nr:OLC1v1014412C1 [Oldenlandia corymbosa var. corymbosa]
MSGSTPVLKKPKLEVTEEEDGETRNGNCREEDGNDEERTTRQEQEEALVALIEHRAKEVEHLRNRITYYQSQLEQAEKRLGDSKIQLARIRGWGGTSASKTSVGNGMVVAKMEERSKSPVKSSEVPLQSLSQSKPQSGLEGIKTARNGEGPQRESTSPSQHLQQSSKIQSQSRPPLLIPAANTQVSHPIKKRESGSKASNSIGSQPNTVSEANANRPKGDRPSRTSPQPDVAESQANANRSKGDRSSRASPQPDVAESQPKQTKRKLELKEHKPLIPVVRKNDSPRLIRCQTGSLMSSQHKRKLRSLILCPTNDQLFSTSSLDGVVNLWQIQGRGSSANLLSSTDCYAKRRWPEDMAWHPQGDRIFSVYSADAGDTQISVLNLNKTKERERVIFLEEKPHVKGIINSIEFMPWEDTCFVTGGSDHAVILWTENDGEISWKCKSLHRSYHSSAVMGVAGIQHKNIVISVGADKRIYGFDIEAMRSDYKHQIDSKCMSVLPNPCDFNLFMVQSGSHGRQLRLFDIRSRQTEIHAFGWKQESSDSQSALINQAWSPDGLYITSGSADPVIHIFDIRYRGHDPSQSIKAHQKRVFKAVWHNSLPLMISISSDLNIGLHKIL